MQEDPYLGDGLNLYAYCDNNPVMYYDPSGYTYENCPSGARMGGDGGSNSQNIAQYERLKKQYAADEVFHAERIGNALKDDPLHRAASYLSQEQLAQGRVYSFTGGDTRPYTLLQTQGQLNGINGMFEYVSNSLGQVTHQRFIPGGIYTGFANQVVPKGASCIIQI